MSSDILVESDGSVTIITLNRPESMNAMNPGMLSEFAEVGQRIAGDPSVRCVIVTGAGRAFCAGGDVKAMAAGNQSQGDGGGFFGKESPVERLRRQEEVSRLLAEMGKPTIAAINGAAAGAGLSVALACDLRIASENARFTTAFAKVGFSGDFGGTWLLQRLVGPAKAKELYFMSDVFGADEALRLGLVTKVVPHDQLMPETIALAKKLAAGPTLAYARMKDNFTYGATATFAEALTREAENMIASGATEDHRNAALAFVEKREPTFQGR